MRLLPALALAMIPAISGAAECTARSAPHVVPVVELYTSEGCSSCPPADRWLSTLAADAAAGRVVPLAFHVDYWDYIGWKDPFASARGTQRQREIQSLAGARYVYTPQVVLSGRDFREWRGASRDALESVRRARSKVDIELVARADAARGIEVGSTATLREGAARDLEVLVAATQDGLASRVTAGENRGERLGHDFVVRDFAVHRGLGKASTTFKPAAGWNLSRMSIAAFVRDRASGEVLQSVSCRL